MRYVIVQVTRSEASERVSEFRPWEVPILQQIHGESLVQVLGEKDYDKIPYPDAQAELERLESRYKSPEGSNQSYVAMVFGLGINGLGRAIKDAEREAKARPVQEYAPKSPADLAAEKVAFEYLKAEHAADVAAKEAELAAERVEQEERLAAERANLEAQAKALAEREKAIAAAEEAILEQATKPAPAAAEPAKAETPKGKAKATPISE